MTKIAVVMICLQNISTIKPCLESLDFADDIIAVDGGSTDGTIQVLEDYGATVHAHEWQRHFGLQRQWSFRHAPVGEEWWWLRVDTDEICPPIFRDSIVSLLDTLPTDIVACRVKQYNLIEDWEHYSSALGGWETHPRLWRADRRLRWKGQVHEYVEVKGERDLESRPFSEDEIADLNLHILHGGWLDEQAMKQKEEQYREMPGSSFAEEGDLVGRKHVVRKMPPPLEVKL